MISTLLLAAAADGVAKLGAGVGAGLAAIGAGIGIGRIGMNKIFTNMIVAAALIEGVALFAVVVAFLCI